MVSVRIAPVLLFVVLAVTPLGRHASASAQIVSVDVAMLRTPFETTPVAELYVAAPPLLVRPYVIVSSDGGKPTVVTQAALPLVARGPFWTSLDAGVTWFPHLGYDPTPTVSGYLGYALPIPRTHAFGIFSLQPTQEYERSYLLGVAYTIHRGR